VKSRSLTGEEISLRLTPRVNAGLSRAPARAYEGGYAQRARSWNDGAWTARKGFQARFAASKERVRGPFTEHRTGNNQ